MTLRQAPVQLIDADAEAKESHATDRASRPKASDDFPPVIENGVTTPYQAAQDKIELAPLREYPEPYPNAGG
jgi:hypothetical protein